MSDSTYVSLKDLYIIPLTGLDQDQTTARIFESSLTDPATAFSAVHKDEDPEVLYLLTHGCMREGSGSISACSSLCSSPESLFGDSGAMRACLMMASLSLGLAGSGNHQERISRGVDGVLKRIEIDDFRDFNGGEVLNLTVKCAMASCRDPYSEGECDPDFQRLGQSFLDGDAQIQDVLSTDYCNNAEIEINNDVAGPGVIISYIIQSFLAVISWLLIRLLTVSSTIDYPVKFFAKGGLEYAGFLQSLKIRRHLLALEDSNFTHATASLIADFHEAQCFFSFATFIAVLFANRQGATFNGVENWASLELSKQLTASLGPIGVLCVMLTQITLHRLNMNSMFSLVCSFTVLIMAVSSIPDDTALSASLVRKMFEEQDEHEKNPVPECGGKPSLRVFCPPDIDTARFENSGLTLLVWLAILIPFAVVKVSPAVVALWEMWYPRKLAVDDNIDHHHKRRSLFRWLERTINNNSLRLAVEMYVELALIAAQIFLAYLIINNLLFLKGTLRFVIGNTSWNIGQVIALLVWAPVVVKYIYTLFFGVEKGFAIRLSRAFIVRRRPVVETPDKIDAQEMVDSALEDGDIAILDPTVTAQGAFHSSHTRDSLRRRGTT